MLNEEHHSCLTDLTRDTTGEERRLVRLGEDKADSHPSEYSIVLADDVLKSLVVVDQR